MKTNTSGADRIIRVVLALVLALLAWKGLVQGTWAIVLYVVAAMLLLTALVGFCPFYRACGIRTNKKAQAAR